MSRLKLSKKLQPAKKAWRSFSHTLQSKVHRLNIPKAFKTTLQRLISTFHSLRHFIHTKARRHSLTRPYYYNPSSSSSAYYHHVHRKNFSAIRIDDLFAEPPAPSSSSSSAEITCRGKAEMGNKDLGGESSTLNTIEDAWKLVVAKSPQLQVDEKAEEFISKFREDIKLQKERSLLEFQERLARSA